MKIEKISENQIRCTLTKEDLASRQIRLTELVYGNEKTKALFQDMMQQAYFEFGFEVNNAPLMIEAIPLSSDSITLVITKVENPEELDSRFSRFSAEEAGSSPEGFGSLSDILEFFSRISQSRRNGATPICFCTPSPPVPRFSAIWASMRWLECRRCLCLWKTNAQASRIGFADSEGQRRKRSALPPW